MTLYQKNSNETGRSLVEMLGVLAIVGVLSVGGIAGYTVAMNKHRANTLLDEASKRAVVVATQVSAGKTASIGEFKDPEGYEFDVETEGLTNQFKITIASVSKAVCEMMQDAVSGNATIQAFEPTTCTDDAVVGLTYNNDMGSGTSTPEEGNTPAPSKCPGDIDPAADGTCPENKCTDNSNCPSGYCKIEASCSDDVYIIGTGSCDDIGSIETIGDYFFTADKIATLESARNWCAAIPGNRTLVSTSTIERNKDLFKNIVSDDMYNLWGNDSMNPSELGCYAYYIMAGMGEVTPYDDQNNGDDHVPHAFPVCE